MVYHHIPYETFHNLEKIHSVQTNQLGVQTASACCKTFSVKMPTPGTSSPGGSDRKISSTWSPRVTKDGSTLKVVTLFDMFNVQEDCERNPAQFRCSCESTISLYLRVGKTPKGIISPSKMPTARQMVVYKNTREPSCHGTLTRVSFSCFRRLAQILPSDTIEKEVRWYQGGSTWIKVDQGGSRWIKVDQGGSRWIKQSCQLNTLCLNQLDIEANPYWPSYAKMFAIF